MAEEFEPELADVPATIDVPAQASNEIAEALGYVTIASGQLEYVLRMWVKSLLGNQFTEAMIVTSRTNVTDLHVIVSAILSKSSKTLEIYSQHAGRALKLLERRNDYVHGLFTFDDVGNPIVVTVKRDAQKGLISKAIIVKIGLIRDLAAAIHGEARELNQLRKKLARVIKSPTDTETAPR